MKVLITRYDTRCKLRQKVSAEIINALLCLGETLCSNIKASKWHESSTVVSILYPKDTELEPAPHRAINRKTLLKIYKQTAIDITYKNLKQKCAGLLERKPSYSSEIWRHKKAAR